MSDLLAFAIAVVIGTAAVTSAAGHVLRPRPRDRLLLWFALFSGIYGLRMFFKAPLAPMVDVPVSIGRWVESSLNYFILIPALLFTEELYGLGWHRSLRWVTIATATFAIGALAINLATGDPGRMPDPSSAVLALLAAVFILGARAGYRPRRFDEWRILIAGVALFLLFVLNEHAVTDGIVPWRFRAEPVGFVLQLGCFGYIALTRVFAQARQLAAVDQEMRSAREIQLSILPRRVPSIRDLQVAARYVPLAAVAGDFYDVVPLDGRALAVLVADVSGHGLPAALIASMVKVAFTSSLRETHDPAAVLRRMNATLCGMFERSFVTAVSVVVRPETGTVSYATAGHPPPLLVPARDAPVAPLDQRGLFLGFLPSATYETTTVPFGTGARLILYTDGVTETPDAGGDLFGIDRLSTFAATERHRSCDAFADALMDSLRRFAGRAALPHDDVTLVVVDVTA